MDEQVIVGEKRSVFITVCVIFGTFFISVLILCLMLGHKEDRGIACWIFIPPTILFYGLVLSSFLFFNHRDIYTPEKMVRIKKGRIVFEIYWVNVEKISYTKPSLIGWLSLGGSYAFFIKTKKGFTSKGFNKDAIVFTAHYNELDVYKIQRIIPIHIDM